MMTAFARASEFSITVLTISEPTEAEFRMGAERSPTGSVLTLNSRYLIRDGRPWMPVMGEFHFARHAPDEWREELLRMKAGGIDIVASYVFWIHHEEEKDNWDWSGRRNLRRFVQLAGEVGLEVAVRIGPWCHGEVRNGGLPDWVLAQEWEVRSDDPGYLERVEILYQEIGRQLEDLLWKDGGPVVAVQLENEYRGPAEHLLTLKRMAIEAGLDLPYYTRTGWPALQTPMPFGELLPLFGAYAEGFWDRELESMPGDYAAAFRFTPVRTEAAIANEQLGAREARDEADAARYPYLTCELGGGMMSSYHRRIRIEPADIESVAIVKVGSGGNLPGYYMYHGGSNPQGRLSTLMESQATAHTNWNDLPVKNYDFYAPLGQYNQIRPHYHRLRRLHLLFRDFGEQLATMPAILPDGGAEGGVRWAVRANGESGFLFVNNHERARSLPDREGVQFSVELPSGSLTLPSKPATLASGLSLIWPFNLDLGHGVRLQQATAQPICRIDHGDERTVFFAATPGVPAEFIFGDGTVHRAVSPGREPALTVEGDGGRVRVVLLDEADSLNLWKGKWQGRERVVLSRAGVVFDGNELRLRADAPEDLATSVFPVPSDDDSATEGIFTRLKISVPPDAGAAIPVELRKTRAAGPPRKISMGKAPHPVAAQPVDEDFTRSAEWHLRLPEDFNPGTDALLRIHYRGDVARVYIGERFIMDDFYNGRALEIGLARHASELRETGNELRIQILPLQADAPIFLPEDARIAEGATAEIDTVEVVPRLHAALEL